MIKLLLGFLFLSFLNKDFSLKDVLERAGENGREVQEFVREAKRKGYKDWAYFLLQSMPDVDLVNLCSDDFISYFDALKKNRERVPWRDRIDDFLFFYYVLPYRVSQEPLEDFTQEYADSLYELIKDTRDMREAVLKINEWVYTQMGYKPTERWDQNALTTIKRGFGRCEEMAILFIKALRTVCIPARGVYTPWWPFTNSNHAWVEVWTDGKWHSLGGGEPTDLDNAWFATPSKRAAIILGATYGSMEGREIIYKKRKGFTLINATPNYTETTQLLVRVLRDKTPQESAKVSLCVYNYSSLPPVGYKITDKDGEVSFVVGRTDLFVYAEKDSLRGYLIYRAKNRENDTLILNLNTKNIPDTSFWLYTKRVKAKRREPSYRPNRDSLKLLQQLHFSKIELLDSSLVDVVKSPILNILYNAKGNGRALLCFYNHLPDSLKDIFISYCDALSAKDLVAIDTSWLSSQLEASIISKRYAREYGIPDSLYKKYVLPDRILYEHLKGWRDWVLKSLEKLRKGDIEETVRSLVLWTRKHIKKVERREYFGPMMNPKDVLLAKRATNLERYLFITGALRSFGIPARVKWDYKGFEYWDGEWKGESFEKEEKEKAWLAIKFYDEGRDVTGRMRYYYDYSITSFDKYPERLEPSIDTLKGWIVATLNKGKYWVVTGWRNGYGDAYVRLKRVEAKGDTEWVRIETGIPEKGIRPGDLIVREYKGLDLKGFGLKREDIEKGDVLIIVFDTESEASKSTLKNGSEAIQGFKGKVYLFAATDNRGMAKRFIKEMGIKGKLYLIKEETYKKGWKIKELPSILRLKDGRPIFWIEGLFLHLQGLMERE